MIVLLKRDERNGKATLSNGVKAKKKVKGLRAVVEKKNLN